MNSKVKVDKPVLYNLVWTSLRYCIGRNSYVGSYYADFAILFDVFTPDERKQLAKDIRYNIAEQLQMEFNFLIDKRIEKTELYRPLELMLEFCMQQKLGSLDELGKFDKIYVTISNGKLEYTVMENEICSKTKYMHDLSKFLGWAQLASFFDGDFKQVSEKGKDNFEEMFETYKERLVEDKYTNCYVSVPIKWDKVYASVKRFKSNALTLAYVKADDKNIVVK